MNIENIENIAKNVLNEKFVKSLWVYLVSFEEVTLEMYKNV